MDTIGGWWVLGKLVQEQLRVVGEGVVANLS